jgi:hypothetical protein
MDTKLSAVIVGWVAILGYLALCGVLADIR